MCTDLRDPKCDRKNWVLTYTIQYCENGAPRTKAFLVCKSSLKQEIVSVPGSLTLCQFIQLLGCSALSA